MRVRRLVPGDEFVVLRAGHLFEDSPDLAAVRVYLADDRNVLLFAFEGSEAVGFLRGTELHQLSTRRKQLFLYDIGVDEPFRRRGVATALIKSLLQDCRERGFEEAFVLTDPANEAAVHLYRSTGALTETNADRLFVYPLHTALEPPV